VKLLLTTDVDNLGRKGDVVEVSDGYARNYLLPRNHAIKASEGAVQAATKAREAREAAERQAREQAEQIAATLIGTRVVLAAQAGDEGKLYGSIAGGDVAEGIRKFTGVELERKNIRLERPIRAIGLHEVAIALHPEVEFTLTIDVIPA
jgi:large subunit ribosomal protein L9